MSEPTNVIRVNGEYLYIVGRDSGFMHPQVRDRIAYKVTWDWHRGEWHFGDDDVWITDGKQIIAREIGWDRRRESCKGERSR